MRTFTSLFKQFVLTVLVAMPLSSMAQNIEINEANFPDVNFRTYLLSQSYGQDGVLTPSEIQSVTLMSVGNKYIKTLQGIEYFTALTRLYCDENQLSSLDVSKNTALTWLWCDFNKLTSLDLSKNTALTMLWCNDNQLTSLDVSKNTALDSLYCFHNNIKGTEMDALINSLPMNTTGRAYIFRVYDNITGDEGNVCTKSQVEAARERGWTPYYYSGWLWVEYEGSDDSAVRQPETVATEANMPIYNIAGQRVGTTDGDKTTAPNGKKGIYIIGGKKVVVR